MLLSHVHLKAFQNSKYRRKTLPNWIEIRPHEILPSTTLCTDDKMIINERIAISVSKVLLVPYCEHHPTLHTKGIPCKELRSLTASEPLTLDEEYAMQRSWRTDGDKLTFIIYLQNPAHSEEPGENMIGDVNMFLTRDGGGGDGDGVVGELELMIAEKSMRGKGLGRAGLLAFLKFVVLHLEGILQEFNSRPGGENKQGGLEYLRVKIGEGNVGSIALFESLGFRRVGEEANIFGEVELRIVGLVGKGGGIDGLLERYGVMGYREVRYCGESTGLGD
ncbi:MAG: hypothetical protein M1839_001298 [Geoglossum umbratile]|nr:MAG: hypothetical protein M1839_001298 [Geoglossum umbratile]